MAIANGTYEMLPLMDVTMAVDVCGNSIANSATVFLWSRNGGNAQKWTLESQGAYYSIRDAETGKSLDVYGNTQAKGTRVIMYTYNSTKVNQRWVVTEVGTQAINGTSYPVVTIGAFAGSSYVLDVTGASTAMRTIIEIWTPNGNANQQFVLVPTEWLATSAAKTSYAALSTPSLGSGGTTQGEPLPSTAPVDSGTYYPCWACAETEYQVAYRTRTREEGADWLGDWSNWKSIADGSTAWDGFGAPGYSNCTPTLVGGRQWSPTGVAIDNSSTYDRTDVEFSVRAWRASWGAGGSAHGSAYTYGVTTVRSVTISSLDLLLSPDGITVAWVSDATQGGNSITLTSDAWGTYTLTGDGSGSATIPQHALRSMPDEGDTVDVGMSMLTVDGMTATYEASVTASYEGSHGTSLTLTATVKRTIATVTASDAAARAWLVVREGHGTRYVPLDGASPWRVAPPLGVPWFVLSSVVGVGSWASVVQEFVPIVDDGWHVTSQDLTRDLPIYVGGGKQPEANPTYARTVTEVSVMGRERPVYVTGDSTKASWTVEGVTYGAWLDHDVALADWAIHAGHVIFRTPWGFWSQACVTGGTVEQSRRNVRAISVTMEGEVW